MINILYIQFQFMVVGLHSLNGVPAQYPVEVELKQEPEDVITQHLLLEAMTVMDLILKLKLVTLMHVQVRSQVFILNEWCQK